MTRRRTSDGGRNASKYLLVSGSRTKRLDLHLLYDEDLLGWYGEDGRRSIWRNVGRDTGSVVYCGIIGNPNPLEAGLAGMASDCPRVGAMR